MTNAVEIFNNFQLQFVVICLDRLSQQKLHFALGDFFNLEGDFVSKPENDCKLFVTVVI